MTMLNDATTDIDLYPITYQGIVLAYGWLVMGSAAQVWSTSTNAG